MIGNLTIVGAKASKGEYEGTKYDSTKLNVLVPYSRSNQNQQGFDMQSAKLAGDSTNFSKLHLKEKRFPFILECDFEFTATGLEIYEVIKINETLTPLAQVQK
ncbi:MAG: hypothetical protein Q8M10_06720 [Methylotenera sp.]|uniref:hypothetical protein n=1 Tax=Methylotenera sp. TaxID=2051956 RepID=UPI002731E9D2|nr:hypothetical protein [Methylotenera sp.]MDP1522833.1 hypothetical protein [Methylotenera sp.]